MSLARGLAIKRGWLFGLSAVLLAMAAHASERRYYFEAVSDERGLASHAVTALLQDHTGFIWIGTQAGLHRYDGYAFRLYEHQARDPSSLPEKFITALAEDAQNRIWVGGLNHGLVALDATTGKVVVRSRMDGSDAGARNAIGALAFDPARGLWIGTAAGIERLDPADGKRHVLYRMPTSAAVPRVFGFQVAGDGSVWAATGAGLLRFAPKSDVAQGVAGDVLPLAMCVLQSTSNEIFACGRDGLYRVGDASGSKRAQRIWPGNDSTERIAQVSALVQDARGRLWLSVYGGGLVVLDPASGKVDRLRHSPQLPASLPDDYINKLLIDRSGLLWVGGTISGVATTDPLGAAFRYAMDPAPGRDQMGNNVRAVLEDRQNRLWLGTAGDGLKRYDPAHDTFEYFDGAFTPTARESSDLFLGQDFIFSLAHAGVDALWVATNRGAFHFDAATRRSSPVPVDPNPQALNGLPPGPIRSVLSARDGSVWFGSYGRGLSHWWPHAQGDARRWEHFRHRDDQPDSLASDTVLCLIEDARSRIWVGTAQGLSVYDPASARMRTFRHDPAARNSLSDNLIRSLYQGSDGTLWVGTQSGLDRIDQADLTDGRLDHFLPVDGIANSSINAIVEDRYHSIWLGTNHGIVTYNRQMGATLAFSVREGLQGMEFNAGAALVRANGELVFGGLHGINLFDIDAIRHDVYKPPVAITAVRVGDADVVPVDNALRMEQGERVVRFEFAALDYAAPSRNRFSYRLRDYDSDWISAGTRHEAVYTNLPAGDFDFEVRAANSDGIWNPTPTVLHLKVLPVWWASAPMRLAYLVIALGLLIALWYAHRMRYKRELRHQRELREREDRLRLALWGSGDEFWDWDTRAGRIYRVGADQLIGGQHEESMSIDTWRDKALHPDDLPLVTQRIDEHMAGHAEFFESEHRIRNAEGGWTWVLSRGKIVDVDADGKPLRICGTAHNITAARKAARERRIASEIIDSMSEAVTVTDLEFNFVSVNRAFTRVAGYTEAECLGQSAAMLNSRQHPPEVYQAMREEIARSGHWHGELWQRRRDGEEFLCWLEISEVRDDAGQRTNFVGVMNDITDRKRAEQELRYLANYDTLTGLPNRTLLGERLAHAVIRARRTSRKVAVLFLDLDRFKHINDSMGHAAGDRVLKAVGERLCANVRETATVARLGGDEFTVVLEDVQHIDQVQRVAGDLLEVFSEPLTLDSGQQVIISPSIGISVYPDHAQVPTDLLKFADTAMYQAKEEGRNMYQMYTPQMDAAARNRAGMLGALRLALERNELSLVFQPILALDEGRITGTEALLRWNSAEFGAVPPTVFIPLAEEAGLIERIGEFVLYRACMQLREWKDRGMNNISMSVNLSALQLLRDELTQRLCEILAELHLMPEDIELELTESVLMANPERAIHTLDRLHAIGVGIAIDDFGTGYSSLSYLKRLPIDRLKIDRSFVGDITTDPDDEAITTTIITMAHSLGLDVIAEGVETLDQLEYLHEQGCDEIQGHWLSVPLDAAACFTFMREFERSRPQAHERLGAR